MTKPNWIDWLNIIGAPALFFAGYEVLAVTVCVALITLSVIDDYLHDQAARYIEALECELRNLAEQHKCGCGHPACNRCYDYEQAQKVLRGEIEG